MVPLFVALFVPLPPLFNNGLDNGADALPNLQMGSVQREPLVLSSDVPMAAAVPLQLLRRQPLGMATLPQVVAMVFPSCCRPQHGLLCCVEKIAAHYHH